jgi:dTDP-4-amino-4,6-dideoxygalactose transaminase/SAM-dependent methyltransferase
MQVDAYRKLADHYDACLRQHGDTAKGADWPNQKDRETRFSVMLDLLEDDLSPHIDLLDFACGTGDLLRYIRARASPRIHYRGVDISADAIARANSKFPGASFTRIDLLNAPEEEVAALAADYCVINGLFTVKSSLADADMWLFMTRTLERLWPIMRKGIAFNVMSKQVDYERSDLFHVSFDRLAEFLQPLAGRNIVFRNDYGLYDYTCFAFKLPRAGGGPIEAKSRNAPSSSPQGATVHMVCRPRLPRTERLRPYLGTIDECRWYSNWGPLTQNLEERLGRHFGLAENACVVASSGTDAITAALIALSGRGSAERPYCLMPSYTFVATAAAALNAGYTPYFLDIDPDTLALDPKRVMAHPVLERAGAVVVVAPYGRPIDVEAWARASRSTGVPVIVDAAAGFDAIASKQTRAPGDIPIIISLHATKVFAAGEGATILCGDVELARRCRRALNFGFLGDRRALTTGINGKMSEYHAAVALAELDDWQAKRAAFVRVGNSYWRAARRHGLETRLLVEREWASCYALYLASSAGGAEAITRRLTATGIDYRFWYGHGVHDEVAYARCPADPLPVTGDLSARLIGLPVSIDLADDAIDHVVGVLAACEANPPTPPSSVA